MRGILSAALVYAPTNMKRIVLNLRSSEGYIVLLTTLIVGVVAVAVATTLLFISTDTARNATLREHSRIARALADACGEEALEQIRQSSTFSGYGTLSLDTGLCGYNVINTGGTNRQINASSTVQSVVRKVRVIIDKVKPINIATWQEVIDL